MIVNNKTKRVVTVAKVRLVPGYNEILPEQWKEMKEDLGPRVGADKEFSEVTETIKDKEGKPAGKAEVKFNELSIEKATAVVEGTLNPEQLNEWLKTESRDSVRKAIYTKLEALEKK